MSLAAQTGEMARRSVLQTLRQPAMVIPPIVFPLVLMAVNVGGLQAATHLPGFPTDDYLNFAIAFPFIQGSLFASINAGGSLARDVETGFLRRLALTPMQRAALLLGNLAGVLVVAMLSAVIYLSVGFAAGLHFVSGAAGVLVMLGLAAMIALAFAALGAAISATTITPARLPISSADRCIGVSASRLRKPVSTSRARLVPALIEANSEPWMNGNAIAKSR